MSTTPTAIAAEQAKFLPRLRGFLGAAFFFALRRFPRLLQLHRNESSWALFRVALACLGAAAVVFPLGLLAGLDTAIFGLVVILVALFPSAARVRTTAQP